MPAPLLAEPPGLVDAHPAPTSGEVVHHGTAEHDIDGNRSVEQTVQGAHISPRLLCMVHGIVLFTHAPWFTLQSRFVRPERKGQELNHFEG